MQHIDEHTLELYVLKANDIADRIDYIEEHLQECSGCQALVGEMSKFYDDLKIELQNRPETEISTEKALVRRNVYLASIFTRDTSSVPYRSSTLLANIFYFVRRHPVAVSLGSFAIVAALGWFLNDAINSYSPNNVIIEKNPSFFLYNTRQNFLEVYNSKDEILWQIASPNLIGAESEDRRFKRKTTLISDINNDSVNEVITTLALREEGDNGRRYLRIINADKKIVNEKKFEAPFEYSNRVYSPFFLQGGILINDFSSIDRKEIYVMVINVGRSPMFIARLDNECNDIGKFWHFGHFINMFPIDINRDGKKEIVLCGSNDTPDTSNQEFAAIAVIDPMKIIGDKKSTTCPGFGWEASNAELFYIRFPYTEINYKYFANPFIVTLNEESKNRIKLFYNIGGIFLNQDYGFDFYFTKDMKILDVKPTTSTIQFYNTKIKEGILKDKIDDVYLENLKNGIRYWDGKEWRKEWTMVKHQP